jgi:hypothetical protein
MTKSQQSKRAVDAPSRTLVGGGRWPAPEPTADLLARGWIAALERLDPVAGDLAGDRRGTLRAAEHWTVETLLKLGFVAPDRAYEVAVRIVELSDDPWILESVGVNVFGDLLRRNRAHFLARLAADARRLPRLLSALDHDSRVGLDTVNFEQLCDLRQPRG